MGKPSEKTGRILIVDDDPDILLTARVVLKKHFNCIKTASRPEMLENILKDHDFDVILLDMNFKSGRTSGEEGLSYLKKTLSIDKNVQIIMMTAYGDIHLAVEAMKLGAADFIVKPWENEKFIATVNTACRLACSNKMLEKLKIRDDALRSVINKDYSGIIDQSEAMKAVFKSIEKVAKTDANVLISGENGTGKELIARAIHEKSQRAAEAFIKVDLGAIPNGLFETELFGHLKGAFTDAKENRYGRFEAASGGSLFLDEISNLNLALQAKLLSAIQNKEIFRLGSNTPVKTDIRLICATNVKLIDNKNFRQDLLYRINTVEIHLPPLRDRKDDIGLLAKHFLKNYNKKYGKELKISNDAYSKMQAYFWPGNIRELQHIIERAVIMAEGKSILADDIPINIGKEQKTDNKLNIERLEKAAIEEALEKHKGNLSKAAEELGLGRTTLYRKLKKYGL